MTKRFLPHSSTVTELRADTASLRHGPPPKKSASFTMPPAPASV